MTRELAEFIHNRCPGSKLEQSRGNSGDIINFEIPGADGKGEFYVQCWGSGRPKISLGMINMPSLDRSVALQILSAVRAFEEAIEAAIVAGKNGI